jgi:hypothetical protein
MGCILVYINDVAMQTDVSVLHMKFAERQYIHARQSLAGSYLMFTKNYLCFFLKEKILASA